MVNPQRLLRGGCNPKKTPGGEKNMELSRGACIVENAERCRLEREAVVPLNNSELVMDLISRMIFLKVVRL